MKRAFTLIELLVVSAGVPVLMHAGGGNMKSQFKKADASGARYALIFGDDELARGEVAVVVRRDPERDFHFIAPLPNNKSTH